MSIKSEGEVVSSQMAEFFKLRNKPQRIEEIKNQLAQMGKQNQPAEPTEKQPRPTINKGFSFSKVKEQPPQPQIYEVSA